MSARSAGPRFWGLSVLGGHSNNVLSSLQIFCFSFPKSLHHFPTIEFLNRLLREERQEYWLTRKKRGTIFRGGLGCPHAKFDSLVVRVAYRFAVLHCREENGVAHKIQSGLIEIRVGPFFNVAAVGFPFSSMSHPTIAIPVMFRCSMSVG